MWAIVFLIVYFTLLALSVRDEYPPANFKEFDSDPDDPTSDQWKDGV